MNAPVKSSIHQGIALQTSLVVLRLLELKLSLEENYGHRIGAYISEDTLALTQDTEGAGRSAAIFHIPIDGTHEIEFGATESFDAASNEPYVYVPLDEAQKLCAEPVWELPIHVVKFGERDYIEMADFLYKWLFPNSYEVI